MREKIKEQLHIVRTFQVFGKSGLSSAQPRQLYYAAAATIQQQQALLEKKEQEMHKHKE